VKLQLFGMKVNIELTQIKTNLFHSKLLSHTNSQKNFVQTEYNYGDLINTMARSVHIMSVQYRKWSGVSFYL
jgi:hypothetical protein